MYTACLFCHSNLGSNRFLRTFPVGRQIAFDPKKGRLWVICPQCARWNLTPLEERWEAIDDAEGLFRGARRHTSTDNIGMTRLWGGFELVRIGPALLPEIAAWRYGAWLRRNDLQERAHSSVVGRGARLVARAAARAAVGYAHSVGFTDEAVLKLRTFRRGHGVLLRARDGGGQLITMRYEHLGAAELIRPERGEPWQLRLRHDAGIAVLAESSALRAAGKILATLNFGVASESEVRHAISKLDDAGDPIGFFTRIASLAMRTSWGRYPNARAEESAEVHGSFAEQLALQLSNRSFWGRGGTTSQEQTPMFRLPAVDRLALEMAANEDVERRAMEGELADLHAAWREAEEVAAIADEMFDDGFLDEFKRQYYERMLLAERASV